MAQNVVYMIMCICDVQITLNVSAFRLCVRVQFVLAAMFCYNNAISPNSIWLDTTRYLANEW